MTRYEDKSDHPQSRELNQAAYKDGCAHYEGADYARAKRAFEEAIEYWPQDPQAWFALGNCHDCMRHPEKAEVCFRMSLGFSAAEAAPDVYFNLGNSLFDQKKYAEAIECYSQVGEQSKAAAAAQKNLALARDRLA